MLGFLRRPWNNWFPVYCDLEPAQDYLEEREIGWIGKKPRGFYYYGQPNVFAVGMRRTLSGYRVVAGCRDFTPDQAYAHWRDVIQRGQRSALREFRAKIMLDIVLPALEKKALELGWV